MLCEGHLARDEQASAFCGDEDPVLPAAAPTK